MASVICPKCKNLISEYDLVCLNCGHTVAPEEREKLVKEHEASVAREQAEKQALHEAEMRLKHRHRLQKKFDRFTVKRFGVALDLVTVFIISLFLIACAAVLMML